LISRLSGASKKDSKAAKKSFSCKKTGFDVLTSPEKLGVYSWRFQDWDYKRDDLPTYARGLFTTKNQKDQWEICTRGYDKFFNTGEVEATKWSNIQANTKGPYELSLKENGCIIFISGLWDGTLLVCSKHSTGPRENETSHAEAGEKWVDRQLAAIGKTRQDLARELRSRNATAVAELCDDEFEEHILAYTKENAGLYLHGININIPEFMTYPGDQVQAFADEWGFKKTDFLVIEEIQEAKKFLDGVAETGSYNGRDVEGFVIRCKARQTSNGSYSDWFFKYKFEEPYLMYRQWRECTKAIIAGKPPKFKKHVRITEEYLLYARNKLSKNKHMAQQYAHNHGIIKLRDDFLAEKNLKGSDIIREEYAAFGGAPEDVSRDIILVPIATIGCGKTTLAVALSHLFNWGHVQNDNIMGKGRPPRFTKEVLTQLEETPVVFADRNNAQRHERQQILTDVKSTHPQVRMVCLNFVHSPDSIAKIREVTQNRVLARGDNHQTIQAATDANKVKGIMEGFIVRYEALNQWSRPDSEFDAIIDLDPTVDSRENLETIVGQLSNLFPKLISDMPTSEDLDEAINFALSDYKPELRHNIGDRGPSKSNRDKDNRAKENRPQNSYQVRHIHYHERNVQRLTYQQQERPLIAKKQKAKPLEYVSVGLSKTQVLDVLETSFASVSSNKARFFRQLQETNRVQSEFHVTLIHRAAAKSHPELWQKYTDLHASVVEPWSNHKMGTCQILLEKIVWDQRVMTIVARIVDDGWECANPVAHVTVGTRAPDVKPKESNDLLKRWLEEGSGDSSGIGEVAIAGRIILDGAVQGTLSR
jgi:tRNA ligase